MKLTSFVKQFQAKNFDFVANIKLHAVDDYLKHQIFSYQERLNNDLMPILKQFANDQLSKTETIIALYKFIKHNRNELIAIYKYASQQALLTNNQQFIDTRDEVFKLLQQGRKFLYWAENVIPKDSFDNKPHLLSRDISEQNKSKARPYFMSDDYVIPPNRDSNAVINNQGLTLPDRLLKEHIDPQHRAWGTLHPSVRPVLEPVHNEWSNQAVKTEDLTVEIEFDEEKKAKSKIENYYFNHEEAYACMLTTNVNNELCLGGKSIPFSTYNITYIFVMDMEGNLFVHPDNQSKNGKRIGHPAFTGGKPVACAGEISIENGKVTSLANASGHYMPGGYSLFRVANELNNRKVLSNTCIFEEIRFDFHKVIQTGVNEDGTINTRRVNKLTFQEFSACYQEKVQSLPPIPAANLAERRNPILILDCLRAINQYLIERGHATNLFHSGADYYKRRDCFKLILQSLNSGNYDQAIKTIDDNFIQFMDNSKKFAGLLIELKAELAYCKSRPESVLENDYVSSKIASYCTMYEQMNKCTAASLSYAKHHSFFSSNAKLIANQVKALNDYKFQRHEISEEYRKEFVKPEELMEIETLNSSKF